MKSYLFKVIIEEDNYEDGTPAFHAYCPAIQSASTWGYTQAEAVANIREVIEMTIESMIEHGEPLPDVSNDQVTVMLEPTVSVTV